MEGEPVEKEKGKRRTKKIKLTAPPSARVASLSLQEWLNLICKPRLSLVELIQLKRTCKSFATYKALKQWIKEKERIAFQGIRQEHWNRFAPTKNPKVAKEEFFRHHAGKYLIVRYRHNSWRNTSSYQLQVCSSREIAIAHAQLVGKVESQTEHWTSLSFRDKDGNNMLEFTTGINDLFE